MPTTKPGPSFFAYMNDSLVNVYLRTVKAILADAERELPARRDAVELDPRG